MLLNDREPDFKTNLKSLSIFIVFEVQCVHRLCVCCGDVKMYFFGCIRRVDPPKEELEKGLKDLKGFAAP